MGRNGYFRLVGTVWPEEERGVAWGPPVVEPLLALKEAICGSFWLEAG